MEPQDSDSPRSDELSEVAGPSRCSALSGAGVLERIRSRVDAKGERRRLGRFRTFAIAIIASSVLLTGGGAAVAITALSGPTRDAAQAVYPPPSEPRCQGCDIRRSTLQLPSQVVATSESDQLAFTGLAVIPLLLLGSTMLGVGAIGLRRLRLSRNT